MSIDDYALRKQIVSIVRSHCLYYSERKWKAFIKSKKPIEEAFERAFTHNGAHMHGGLFAADEVFDPPQNLPAVDTSLGKNTVRILFPECATNNEAFQHKYIKTGNALLCRAIDNDSKAIIDLRNNFGGKPSVIIAALAPLLVQGRPLQVGHKRVLSYYVDRKNKYHRDVIIGAIAPNTYEISTVSDAPTRCSFKTHNKSKYTNVTVFVNSQTMSAAEQAAIVLKSAGIHVTVTDGLYTAGDTTTTSSFNLGKYILTIPIGVMCDAKKRGYKYGIF